MSFQAKWGAARAALARELPPMWRLALPVVIAELGWFAMGLVDTIMVGRISAESIGAVSIGSALFYTIGVFGTGMLLGLDTLVPQAFAAGDLEDCHHSLIHAVYGALVLGPLLMIPMFLVLPHLAGFGVDPLVVTLTTPYTQALLWSAVPLLLFMAFRHYLQGMNQVRIIMIVLLTANLVNVFANWVFIYGNLGSPAFGVEGAGWASCASRAYMCLALLAYLLWDARKRDTGLFEASWALDVPRIKRLAELSFPAAAQRALEIGVFALATAIIGTLDPISLAAHHVALQIAGLTFMVPLGISSAAAVRVGQAIGRRDPDAAHHAGWAAIALGAAFMACAGVLLFSAPQLVLRLFTDEPEVIRIGVTLIYLAAVFQLFDGLQVVATGALRGAGDTKRPMLANLVAHWFLGLPIGWWLGLRLGWGAPGVWTGLCLGLIAVGGVLVAVWATRLERLRHASARV